MQKISHFWAQMKKKLKMSVRTLLPGALQLLFTLVDNLLFEVAVVSWCVSQYSKSIKER